MGLHDDPERTLVVPAAAAAHPPGPLPEYVTRHLDWCYHIAFLLHLPADRVESGVSESAIGGGGCERFPKKHCFLDGDSDYPYLRGATTAYRAALNLSSAAEDSRT